MSLSGYRLILKGIYREKHGIGIGADKAIAPQSTVWPPRGQERAAPGWTNGKKTNVKSEAYCPVISRDAEILYILSV